MLRKFFNAIRSIFVNEVRVMRPGEEAFDTPLNRRQRRAKAAIIRKQARRRKHAKES